MTLQTQQAADPADVLLDALLSRMAARTKAAGTPPNATYAHGPGGMLGQFGLPADLVNAMVLPLTGLAARMPIMLSPFTNEVFTILTGQTASSGQEPTTACGDARQPGNLKTCSQTWPFGRIVMDSQIVQADRAGELINRGEFIDQSLIGNPFGEITQLISVNPRDALRSVTKKKLLELMNDLHRDYGHLLYDANPANTAGSQGYIEFNGLDRLINNNYQDVSAQQACPAANSYIEAFDANVEADPAETVAAFTEIVRHLRYLAERTGLLPVKWVWTMRYSLFMKLTELWPCAYMTYRCRTAAPESDAQIVIDGREQERMRAEMRRGKYLLIDDEQVEVVIDDFIDETASAGVFTSGAYYVPETIAGGRRSLYWQYFNLAGPYGMQEAIGEFAPNSFKVLGGGRYWLHHKPPSNECIQVRVGYKPRIILEAPFLAARLTGLSYTARIHERSGDPNDPYYHFDGGIYQQPDPSFYPPLAEVG
jgi:hypothetical protein